MAKPLRKQVEILSTPILRKINNWPRPLVPILLLVFLLFGLFVPGTVGGFFILLVGLFVGWLLYLSWPLLPASSRIFRLLAVAVILASGLTQIFIVR